MPDAKEIKGRIKSVSETQKITNAMYLIASTKLQKAKKELDASRPYFDTLRSEVRRILWTIDEVKSRYLFKDEREIDRDKVGCLVITADKGLAGAYNINVLKLTGFLQSIRMLSFSSWVSMAGSIFTKEEYR